MKQVNQKLAFVAVLMLGIALGESSSNFLARRKLQDRNRKPVPSGSLMSVPLLEKISESLESIDKRLERMEESLSSIAKEAKRS